MSRKWIVIPVGVLLFGSGYLMAHSQQKEKDDAALAYTFLDTQDAEALLYQNSISKSLGNNTSAEEALKDFKTQVAPFHKQTRDIYKQAVMRPDLAREIATLSVFRYLTSVDNVKSAAQASQLSGTASLKLQALQVAQNARIIELLEKIAAKK